MAKLLKDKTAQRLLSLLNAHAPHLVTPFRTRGNAPRWVMVRCTSATAVGGNAVLAQCYPAIILFPSSFAAAPPEEGFPVLLTVLGASGNSVVPVSGKVYPSLLTGEAFGDASGSIAGRPRVFSIELASASGDMDGPNTTHDNAVPKADGTGLQYQESELRIVDQIVNGDPAAQFQMRASTTLDGANDPLYQIQVQADGEATSPPSPRVYQEFYTDPGNAYGQETRLSSDTSKRADELRVVTKLWDGSAAVTLTETITAVAGAIQWAVSGATLKLTGTWDFGGATVSGLANSGTSTWIQYVVNYNDAAFNVAATQATKTLYSTGTYATAITAVGRVMTAFAGTGITALTGDVGTASAPTNWVGALDLLSGGNTFNGQYGASVVQFDTGVGIQIQLTSTGGNLNAMTAGQIVIWVLQAKLPPP